MAMKHCHMHRFMTYVEYLTFIDDSFEFFPKYLRLSRKKNLSLNKRLVQAKNVCKNLSLRQYLHYLPIHNLSSIIIFQQIDNYSITKTIAERYVLSMNGIKLSNHRSFHTCALRFRGIYGPAEPRSTQRTAVYLYFTLMSLTYFVNSGNVSSWISSFSICRQWY